MSAADAVDAHSAEALRLGSGSFAAAARFFDPAMRRDAQLLYAWCRHCDDVIDGQVLGRGQIAADAATDAEDRMRGLEQMTRAALAGERIADPAFVAFQRVAMRRRIPERYPLDLLTGFRMDVGNRRYRTLDDTLAYSYHVAGVVGLMMALIMGVRPEDDETLDRACDLGIAFQLTNIARDAIEDAERGRVYLPEDWLRDEGVPQGRMADTRFRPAVHRAALRLLDAADAYYASAGAGLPRLPIRAAMAIGAARAVYRGIGTRLQILGPDAWDRRVAISAPQKLALVLAGAAAGIASRARSVRPSDRNGLWTRPGRDVRSP